MANSNRQSWSERYPGWALITGASSGLGACFARGLAARGLSTILVARRQERLERLAAELQSDHQVETLVISIDLVEDRAIGAIGNAVGERAVSVLINNAGIGLAMPFHESDPEHLDRMIRLNCLVPTLLARRFIPPMIERRKGAHILLSSLAGFQPVGHFSVYAATKAYNLFLGEALWAEERPLGVDTLVLAPGYTATEFQTVSGTQNIAKAASAEEVVEGALRALGRKPVLVPGIGNKATTLLARIFPRSWVARLGETIGRKMIEPKARERYVEARRRDSGDKVGT